MKVRFTETVLRDAQQSLLATRMPYSVFKDILQAMDKAGYYILNAGRQRSILFRYLNEDPWTVAQHS